MNLKEIKDAWLRYLMNNLIKIKKPSREIQKTIDKRFNECISCENMKVTKFSYNRLRRCGVCNCAFPALIFSYSKKCPIGKWGPADTDQTDT